MNYGSIDKMYTVEEYKILRDLLPFSVQKVVIKFFLTKNRMQYHGTMYKHMSQWFFENEPKIYNFMYEIELPRVALFINKRDLLLDFFVTWRLQINK